MGVADANRAHFDNVVAPTLLPPDLAQFRILSTAVTYARLGSVAVLNQFDALVKFQGNVPASNFEMCATISDLGETWQGRVRKCEPISSAAAYRKDVATVVSQMERDAKLWTQHYSTPGQAPFWQQIAMNLSQAGVGKETIKLESEVVRASKEESQPITPYWTAIMLGDYAQGKSELKVFFSCEKMQWQILVPEAWWDWQ